MEITEYRAKESSRKYTRMTKIRGIKWKGEK